MEKARHVFVTGGTGYMGRRVIPALAARGHRVLALAREGSQGRLPAGCEAVVMKAYVQARAEAEAAIRAAGLNATFVRPWYVLGPGHRWPYFFLPVYGLLQLFPPTRDTARRLYPVTLEQMVAALVAAVERPAAGIRIVETPEIRRTRLPP